MMQLSTVARRITGGAALLALLAGVSACTGDDDRGAAQSSPASSASTGPSAAAPNDAEMQQYRMAVDDANANVAATIIAAGGRPTVVRQGAQANTMVIRDEGAEAWQAGNYRLVVYCAGSGTLYANFRLGSTAQIEELPPCSPSVTTGAVSLRLAAAAKGSAVIIIPAGNTNAAVSYQIQRG
jgi:hypothetical protein